MAEKFHGKPARREIRDFLIEKFAIPSFVNDGEIQLVINKPSAISSQNIAARAGDAPPPDLVRWLLANHQNINWPKDEGLKYQWLIWSKGRDGISTSHELELTGSAAFPPLQWGEIVECRITMSIGGTGDSSNSGLPPEVVAALRRHLAFPITFESDGKSRELTLRGDKICFDPTQDEVPLTNLQQLVARFWQPSVIAETWPTIQVSRKDWPDVRLSYGSKEAEKFQLEAGDRVKLEISDQPRENLAKARPLGVTLKVTGYPFTRFFGSMADEKLVSASIPTLI